MLIWKRSYIYGIKSRLSLSIRILISRITGFSLISTVVMRFYSNLLKNQQLINNNTRDVVWRRRTKSFSPGLCLCSGKQCKCAACELHEGWERCVAYNDLKLCWLEVCRLNILKYTVLSALELAWPSPPGMNLKLPGFLFLDGGDDSLRASDVSHVTLAEVPTSKAPFAPGLPCCYVLWEPWH